MALSRKEIDKSYDDVRRIFEDIFYHQSHFKDREECMLFLTLVWRRFKQHTRTTKRIQIKRRDINA